MLFISYSHQDEAFANRLAARLLKERVAIWWDRIGIKVGDSLLEKIQGAISEADYLAVVLSKASVASAWCREELNAGLMRQLAEKRVVVLPLLMEECNRPPFLLDKKYANFAKDFEKGFQELKEAIAVAADPTLGRHESGEYHTDYGLDWNVHDGRFVMELDGVSFSEKEKFSVMVQIRLTGNEVATRRYRQFAKAGLNDIGLAIVIGCCEAVFDSPEAHISIGDNKAVTLKTGMLDAKTGIGYEVSFWARRIGEATGTSLLYHFGAIFGDMFRELMATKRPLSDDQKRKLAEILKSPPS